MDKNIQRLKDNMRATGSADLTEIQDRAKILRDSAEVFRAAVERYKVELRNRVGDTASTLFLSMTTEKEDYAGLTINDAYGLTIRHRDGRAEEARSAGAEHVVALALMGAQMAEQIVLLVYEAEVGRERMRNLLRGQLVSKYQMERVSGRRTNLREVK